MKPKPHISPTTASAAITAALKSQRVRKNRGNYNCRRCGQPKKGHICNIPPDDTPSTPITSSEPISSSISAAASSSRSTIRLLFPPPLQLRRALSFDESEVNHSLDESDLGETDPIDTDLDSDLNLDTVTDLPCGFPVVFLWEVLRRLPPSGLIIAARVCRGWREIARKMWKAAEELKIRVPEKAQIGYIGSLLQKCPGLVRLSLMIESDLDATTLACIAFSCPSLEMLEISTLGSAVNRISGGELGRFVENKQGLTSLKMEGCSNLGGFVLCSPTLSTLWLSDLHSLSKMVFNCPNLKEISLEFSRQEHDSTDLLIMFNGLGRTCKRLENIHIASLKLSHSVVLALTAANFRGLRMLSLVLGTEITDASVAALSSSYTDLELLDLSGSSITDSGIGMICNVFPDTLTRLLLALCPKITSSGIQYATAQLPLLELMDCGMTVSDLHSDTQTIPEKSSTPQKTQLIGQKMFIKHSRLKKLSLWGCSSLDTMFLNCPELKDLNLNRCNNLHPERLVLLCPKLQLVYASGCQDMLTKAIRKQVLKNISANENNIISKRLADSSKRIQAPPLLYEETGEDSYMRKRKRIEKDECRIIV
ncbi:hypothetical protein AALP_AA7G118300 [Arabis alpina]|uniref:F-box domain-containing protein n=1 Tax=Arabis alpina TaxID=50452 RepID=A0A087GHH0_ARAAL|nr:hypothetical protein AALP_AA7G118300 [Arabis alpina]